MPRLKLSRMLQASCRALLGLLAMALSLPVHASGRAPGVGAVSDLRNTVPQQAIWVRRQINLVYLQTTTHYSCYFVRDYVRHILLQLGARKEDLELHPVDCGGGPPSVAGSFYVLEPAGPLASAASGPGPPAVTSTVAAHWASVEVSYNDPVNRVLDVMTQCQLVRTVFDRVLPLFAVRDAQLAPSCEMYSNLTNAAVLRARVLEPDAPGAPE